MYHIKNFDKVNIVVKNNCFLKGFYGTISLDEHLDYNELERIFNEAQNKYQRMHYDNPSKRFEKSWTGELGEIITKHVITNSFKCSLLDKPDELMKSGYDYGDVHFYYKNARKIINVTSRRLSDFDNIMNIVKNPDQYFILIPTDQWNQYMNSDYCFPVFIKFDRITKTVMIKDVQITFNPKAEWIVYGFLTKEDLKYLKESNYLITADSNEQLKGLFGDLNYSIRMYANNHVIFLNDLRNFDLF